MLFTKDNIYLVTGASSGIGRASAYELNKLGASVIVTGRNEATLKALKEELEYPDNMHIEVCDLSSSIESLSKWVIDLSNKYGKLSGLVLSAGISVVQPLSLIDYSSLKTTQDILFNANIMLIKGFANKKAHKDRASIVIISSDAALYGIKGLIEYSSTKAALLTAAKAIANELYHKGIRVNTISPGLILTPMVEESVSKGETNPELLMYAGKPEYVADVVSFLLSEKSCWITGQNIVVDGGASLPHIYNK